MPTIRILSVFMILCCALPAMEARAEIPQVCHDAFAAEDAAEAIELWDDCLDQKLNKRTRGIAFYNRARRRMDLPDPDAEKAIEDYSEAAKIAPTDGDIYTNRGYAYLELDRTEDALSDFTRAIAMNPKDADAYANRAVVNMKGGELKSAVYDLEQAIRNDPTHLRALRGLATLLAMEQDKEIRDGQRAVEVGLRLVQLERTWETLEILAAAHAEAGQFHQAVAAQEEALELARASEEGTRVLERNLERYRRDKIYE